MNPVLQSFTESASKRCTVQERLARHTFPNWIWRQVMAGCGTIQKWLPGNIDHMRCMFSGRFEVETCQDGKA